MIKVKSVGMEFDLNRGKVRTLKEKLFAKVEDEMSSKQMFKALDDISFEVEKGEIFGVIGGNGAGKSTLLKILAGIMKPTHGSVEVEGTIAPMIELGTGFDYELSALENIYLSGSILGYNKKFLDSKVIEIFNFSELWEFKDVPVKYFSSGMVARLAFAVSTIVVPDVLIVDEILSVGDMAFQKKSYKRMVELMNSGTTVVYVSHDVKTLGEMCNRVMWIEKGKVKMIDEAHIVCSKYIANLE
ncbi:Teichoic acids export ATP-binding protein TagH [bioreactor metagenome]|uniref:Teichoic acids export ATP-binding protein TagH n=1 Tax=bioreactor metagenome TaxID=1076179 RepID=A0A644VXU3_9ZZZZ